MTGDALALIDRIGRTRFPAEACGLLLPVPDALDRVVIELPNRSLTPSREYEFFAKDAAIELAEGRWATTHAELSEQIAIWHTHPGGSVGPSDEDLRYKQEGVLYLVVALHDDGTNTPAWF